MYCAHLCAAPPHVINEHVSLVKAVVHQGAAAVANGTLRCAALPPFLSFPSFCCLAWARVLLLLSRLLVLGWAGLGGCGGSPATPLARVPASTGPPFPTPIPSRPPPPSPLPRPAPACSNIVRAMEAGTLPEPPPPAKGMSFEAAADALATGTSHPTWMVAGWLRQYGPPATVALLQSNNKCVGWPLTGWHAP